MLLGEHVPDAADRQDALRVLRIDLDGRADEGGEVMVAMVSHEGPEKCVAEALRLLEGSASLTAAPLVMPILAA